jgi:hypothetical protein
VSNLTQKKGEKLAEIYNKKHRKFQKILDFFVEK